MQNTGSKVLKRATGKEHNQRVPPAKCDCEIKKQSLKKNYNDHQLGSGYL